MRILLRNKKGKLCVINPTFVEHYISFGTDALYIKALDGSSMGKTFIVPIKAEQGDKCITELYTTGFLDLTNLE